MQYNDIDIHTLIRIAVQAGEAIMQIYTKDFSVETKADSSPLTEADRAGNAIILAGLQKSYPAIPFISEENKATAYEERKHWKRFWLIDPLDGTKEFVKKNGEFTVNIALIEEGVPTIGIVGVPAQNKVYFGAKGLGSFVMNADGGEATPITNKTHYSERQLVRVVASRSHMTDETLQFVEALKAQGKDVDFVSSGSSLKFCLVAEGAADVYPRFGPTMEWDTGAAHAVALYAGKQVFNHETKQPLQYNKENLLNPFFIVE